MALSLHDLRCYAQRALLDHVWPDLRAVYVEEREYFFEICFYHHGPITEFAQDLIGCIITEVTADCYNDEDGTEYCYSSSTIQINFPLRVPQLGCCIYHRYESIPLPRGLNRQYLQKCLNLDPTGQYLESDLDIMLSTVLLGRIPPNLRGTIFGLEEGTLHLHFYFDGAIQPKDEQLVEEAIAELSTEMNSWVLSKGLLIKSEIIRLDYPARVRGLERTAYFRYEPTPSHASQGGQNGILNS